MNILYVITGLGLGGAEMQLLELSIRLQERGYNIQLVVLADFADLKPKFEQAGIPIEFLNIKSILKLPAAIFRFIRIVKKFRPDIVHSHMVHANLFTRICRCFKRYPKLINTAHSNYEGGALRMFLYRITDPLCDLTTNVGRSGMLRFIKLKAVPRDKIIHIPNGININKFKKNEVTRDTLRKELRIESSYTFISVARLVPEKGHRVLLTAYKMLCDAQPRNYKLLIVGDGPLRAELENLAGELGVTEQVLFLGSRLDVAELLNASDCFILASIWEGFGLALAEAMACGLPAISTRSGGPEEIFGEDSRALVPPGDAEKLFTAMQYIVALNTEERERLVRHAKARIITRYSLDSVRDLWISIYNGTKPQLGN